MAFLRARDVEFHFRNKGAERGALYVCTVLAEQQVQNQQDIRQLAELIDQMSNIMNSMMGVADNMKNAVETINGNMSREEGLGASTTMIGDSDE
jgi:t-SNARE complex subunit (syntaxin)